MDVSASTRTCMVSPSLPNQTISRWRWFSWRISMPLPRGCSACYCGCKTTMWPSSTSHGKHCSSLMDSHDCPGPSNLLKLNWTWPSTWFTSARSVFKSCATRLHEIPSLHPCVTSSSVDGLTPSSRWPSHSGHTGPTGTSCPLRMASSSKAVSKCWYLLPCKSIFLMPYMQVTKAVTSVSWELSGVYFGMASTMTLRNALLNAQFAKRKLHLSARNPWYKKTFHHEHGIQSAQTSLTSWEKNICSWLTTFQNFLSSSACPGTVAAKQPRKP